MRHLKKRNRLSLPADQRKAVLRTLANSFFKYGEIKTTLGKAKAVQREIEKLVTLAKRGDMHARRQASGFLYEKDVLKKLFNETVGNFKSRKGGYTRLIKTVPRRGDAAPTAILQLVN
ncbi:MAG: 50S ribosomal protein L17 [Candidatus Melainabacteria bacterium RIFCSPHIGHO2_02_FULL_34_12]|nr:MAG: 50S ribosomal protein L17 [Candidatus Melainabacteria bacterium RIFCSPHIGHO2_02_FULL_34_12]